MSLQYNPYALPLILAAIVSVILGVAIWRRRPGPGIIPFVLLMAGVTQWSLSGALEHSFTTLEGKLFMGSIVYVGITTVPAAWLAFALEYTGREKWLTRRNIALLFIEPVLTVIATFTNPLHHWFHVTEFLDTTSAAYPAVSVTFGWAFWVHAVYSYILLLGGTALLIQAFIRSPQLYRGQIAFLLIGAFAPWLGNAIFIFGLSPFPNLDLTPFGFTITGVAMAWSIYRYRLLDIVPVARDMVIESMGDALIVLDARNRTVDLNPAALQIVGLTSKSDAVGKPMAAILADRSDLVDRYRDVENARAEIALDQKGEKREFELRISPLRNAHGDLIGRLAVLHDITERKQAARQIEQQNEALVRANSELAVERERAEEANKLKSEFLAIMSHELRTPLNSVIGYADLILSGVSGPMSAKQEDYLRRIMGNGERLLTLINEVLDLSKIEAGRFELINQPFLPAQLLNRVKAQMQELANKKKLQLIAEVDPKLSSALLTGDPVRLEQILVNLVGNGIKFTESGHVKICLSAKDDSHWQMVVSDTGIGIPPHAVEFIFDKFRQVDGTSQREHDGTGLGLSIVQRLAKLMGGTVTVESQVGVGSTFTVQLPLIMAKSQTIV